MPFPKQRLIKYWILIVVLLLLIPLLQSLENSPEEVVLEPVSVAPLTPSFPTIEQTQKELLATNRPSTLAIQKWQTENGAQVLFLPAPELPMVDLRLIFDAGSARDGTVPGLAQVTNGMLAEGSLHYSADQIASGFEELGAQFSNSSHRDMSVLSLRSLSQPELLQPAVALFTDLLSQPAFQEADLNRLIAQAQTYLRYQEQQPGSQASKAFYRALYNQHPYAHPSMGNAASLETITPQQLRDFHQQYYVAQNLTIAIVGQLTAEQAQALAHDISQTLPTGTAPAALPTVEPTQPQQLEIPFPTEQTTVLVGTLGITRQDPDYPALYLANHILGGSGFSSRLMQEIREQRGLTYGVSSGFTPMSARGPFSISLKTRSDQTEQALDVLHQQLELFASKGPSDSELESAKRNILGSYPLSIASNAGLVGQLGSIGFYDLPKDHLQQMMQTITELDSEQVRSAFAKILHQGSLIQVTVGQTPEAR